MMKTINDEIKMNTRIKYDRLIALSKQEVFDKINNHSLSFEEYSEWLLNVQNVEYNNTSVAS